MGLKKMISKMILGNIVHKVRSEKDFDSALKDLHKAIAANGFTVKHTHDLREAFAEKNLSMDKDFEYRLVQFCNAKKAHTALSMSTDVGIMMPKTIIIFRKDGETWMQFMKMKPFMVSMMFPDINLAPMSKKVMATMGKIVEEAA